MNTKIYKTVYWAVDKNNNMYLNLFYPNYKEEAKTTFITFTTKLNII